MSYGLNMAAPSGMHHNLADAGPKLVNRLRDSKSPYVRRIPANRTPSVLTDVLIGAGAYEQSSSMAAVGHRSHRVGQTP